MKNSLIMILSLGSFLITGSALAIENDHAPVGSYPCQERANQLVSKNDYSAQTEAAKKAAAAQTSGVL
jgi:hypothetical protein